MSVFFLDSGLRPQDLLRGLGEVFPMETLEQAKESLTYRDTFDWRLLEAGLTLTTSRAGRKGQVTLTTLEGRVLEAAVAKVPLFASDLPPHRISDIIRPVTGPRRLFPKAQAEWRTTLVAILNKDGKTVVRLLLREGEAVSPHGMGKIPLPPRLRFLPLKGYRSQERRVRKFLRKNFVLKRDDRTELSSVYHAVGQTPGDYSSSFHLNLDPGTPSATAARSIHQTLLKNLLANQEGVIRNWDPEFLHDFRVAIRRTRSALNQLKGIFPEADVDHFSEEFRWLGTKTGPGRDFDVYLLKIPAYRKALHPGAQKDLEPLVQLLQKKKRVEQGKLRRCMKSKRYHGLLEDWEAFLGGPDAPDSALPNAQRPIREVASEQIWKAFIKVLSEGGKTGRTTSARALHRLRLRCKKLRYLITFFRTLYPADELNPFIAELKRLQDHLGDFNDLQMQQEALHRFAEEMLATEMGPPATLLAMGQLMGQLEGQQIVEREAFRRHFRQFSRPRNQKRFRKLFGTEPGKEPIPPAGEEPS